MNKLLVTVANGPSELPLEYCTCPCETCNRKEPTQPEKPPVSGETEIKVVLSDVGHYNVADNGFGTGKTFWATENESVSPTFSNRWGSGTTTWEVWTRYPA